MNKTLIDYILKENREYSQNDCFYLCSNLFAIEESNCNCKSTLDDFSKNCITQFGLEYTNEKNCASEYLKDFRKNKLYEKCSQYCPLECDSMHYIINTYNEQFPVDGNISAKTKSTYNLHDFKTFEEIKKHFIGMYVYYNDFRYTLISEEPETELFNFIYF